MTKFLIKTQIIFIIIIIIIVRIKINANPYQYFPQYRDQILNVDFITWNEADISCY